MTDVKNSAGSLEAILRARAEKELIVEVERRFDPIVRHYYGKDGGPLLVLKLSADVCAAYDSSICIGDDKSVTLFIPELLRLMKKEIIDRQRKDRGDDYVVDFLRRFGQLVEEVDKLREDVDDLPG